MGLTQEMRKHIELLTTTVVDDAEIAKALQRKFGRSVSALSVRSYRSAIAVDLPPATRVTVPPSPPAEQAPIAKKSSAEIGSTMLMASICRLAFRQRKLLPHMTLEEQRERARADGYSGSIEGWA